MPSLIIVGATLSADSCTPYSWAQSRTVLKNTSFFSSSMVWRTSLSTCSLLAALSKGMPTITGNQGMRS